MERLCLLGSQLHFMEKARAVVLYALENICFMMVFVLLEGKTIEPELLWPQDRVLKKSPKGNCFIKTQLSFVSLGCNQMEIQCL